MELLNGTENRIRELDKNVWGYCINMFSKLFNLLTPAAKSLKSKEQDTSIEIDKLETYINDYRTESQKLINNNNNCSEDENEKQIEEIFKKGELVINHFNLIKSNLPADLSAESIDIINNLIDSFEHIKNQTKDRYLKQLKICKKKKIIKDGNYKVVNELIKDKDLYYIYDSETKTVTLLGQYKGTEMHKFHDDAPLSVFVFENDGKTVEISKNNEIFIKNPVNPEKETHGGKPRRTRRHKNKKRRSSKQQKSKK